jgi:DNA-binding NarL/FixJ family response regulator
MQSFTVLVVDDYEPWLRSVCSILKAQPELQVISEASNGAEAVQKAQMLKPDLILLDIGLLDLNGIEAEDRIRRIAPDIKILFLTRSAGAEFTWPEEKLLETENAMIRITRLSFTARSASVPIGHWPS